MGLPLSKKALIGTIGAVMFFFGAYMFPFGSDIFYSFLIDLGGGSIIMGFFYAYIISYTCMLAGVFMIKPNVVYTFGNPIIFILLSIFGYGAIYLGFVYLAGGM